jgi:hypothetical protein
LLSHHHHNQYYHYYYITTTIATATTTTTTIIIIIVIIIIITLGFFSNSGSESCTPCGSTASSSSICSQCTSSGYLRLPTTLTSIVADAFYGCTSPFTATSIPTSVTSIGIIIIIIIIIINTAIYVLTLPPYH